MHTPFSRAPHSEAPTPRSAATHAPNAALLIDFDNVTMGMRSDLSKELRNLLNSDVIRGKVAVQRAYADWRRYPQYIVPLAENSVDLIFAPAYGSSKKNATDIRMAIDGMELIFTRPEIGTFILLTGDSDFSSLVLKLKEYGKYVIGVGIQESSSDLLVQNCDEYYSYTALTGLRRAGEEDPGRTTDPWVLVEKAVEQMIRRKDVMRSDRLKQVMLEIDQGFDEGSLGFSKFSRFLSEAAQKSIISLTKLENGQYEVGPKGGGDSEARGRKEEEPRRRERGRDRDRDRDRRERDEREARVEAPAAPVEAAMASAELDSATEATTSTNGGLPAAYDLLRKAVAALAGDDPLAGVRDSDVKRKMLAFDSSFDEATLGFPKFSRFLRQAHDQEVVDLRKGDNGTYEVALRGESSPPREEQPMAGAPSGGEDVDAAAAPTPETQAAEEQRSRAAARAERSADPGRRLQPRLARGRRRPDGPPPLLEGQVVVVPGAGSLVAEVPEATPEKAPEEPRRGRSTRRKKEEQAPVKATRAKQAPPTEAASTEAPEIVAPAGTATAKESPAREAPAKEAPKARAPRKPRVAKVVPPVDPSGAVNPVALGLPTDPEEVVRYLSTSYKGVGRKTAESLVEVFGDRLFTALNTEPQKVRNTVAVARAEMVLDGWRLDLEKRLTEGPPPPVAPVASVAPEVPAAVVPDDEESEVEEVNGNVEGANRGEAGGPRRRTRRSSRKGRGGRGGGSD